MFQLAKKTAARRLLAAGLDTDGNSIPGKRSSRRRSNEKSPSKVTSPGNVPANTEGYLEGYTGPEALAKQMSMMDRIKAKAIKSVSKELGACPQQLQEVMGTKVIPESQAQGEDESKSDAHSDDSSLVEQRTKMTPVPIASSTLGVTDDVIVVPSTVEKTEENDDSYIQEVSGCQFCNRLFLYI